ncbi:hypothetical protein EDB80DRAFT_596402, partial [Ilyonectria destructans]
IVWNTIALYRVILITLYKEPEVTFIYFSIIANFFRLNFPNSTISIKEYKKIIIVFLYIEFTDILIQTIYRLYRDKLEITFNNNIKKFKFTFRFNNKNIKKEDFYRQLDRVYFIERFIGILTVYNKI